MKVGKTVCVKFVMGGVVEDQSHFVLYCPAYTEKRNIFTEKIKNRVPNWEILSDNDKFTLLFKDHARIFARFVKDLFMYRKSIVYK